MTDNILKYKTRGKSRPDGKSKVFLCCHTGDFEKYFMLISNDILEFQNCSIWYMESKSISLDSNMMFDLSQMQLFVAPVTYQFLVDDTDPAIEIFQFALKQNIPILPIMVETDLVYFYERRFGSIQFLDRINNDPTTIPYSVKLSQYLSQVLISDDTIEKIHSEFQTYIFLSYRQKDRIYAQRVMKKIHENAYYEDVAIWYDEFLVPGEPFDEKISKTLEKSNLFSIVVTPNIVNEKNYIMDVEYPMAQKLDKTILPIEIVSTDRMMLQKCYIDMPEPVKFSDDSSLQTRLKMALPEVVDAAENNASHDFFIGLAYLSGIDVERDQGKGIELIEKAAEAGLEEAIRKLIVIYSKGVGLAQNFEKAYAWEEKLTEKYQIVAEQSGKDADSMVYLKELMNFISLAEEGGDAEKGVLLCEKAYEVSSRICFGKGKTIARTIRFILKRKWNNEYYDEAMYYLLKSSRFALRFSRDMDIRKMVEKWLNRVMLLTKYYEMMYDNKLTLAELLAVYNDLTDIAIKSEKYDKVGSFLETMSIILTDIFDTTDSVDFKFYQALIYRREGELNQAIGNWAQAHTVLQKHVDLLLEIADEYPENMAIVTRLIEGQSQLVMLYCREKNEENAEKCLSAILRRIENLQEKGYMFDNRPIYAQTKVLAGDILCLKNDDENALDAYSAAYDIFSAIIKNNVSAQIYRDLSAMLLRMGDCCERLGKYEEAAKKYDESRANISDIFFFSKSVIDAQFQANVCERLWKNAINRENALLEKEWYEKLLCLRTDIVKATSSSFDSAKLNDLIRTRKNLKKEGKIGNIDYDNPFCLVNYIIKNSIEYDEKVQLDIEMKIGELVDKYWQINLSCMDDKTTIAFTSLTLLLTRTGKYSDRTKEDEAMAGKLHYGSIVLKFLLKHSNAFSQYDECAVLILNYCGYYAIDSSKHMVGGKKQGMEDFWSYYTSEPFWLMPVQRIQYPDLWRAMHYWIMTTKHKYI